MRRLLRILSNNFGLKLLALGFAIILWLLVVNVEDPEKTRLFTIPVSIENEEFLTSMGKTYEIIDETDRVTFSVVGKRSIVDKMTESDFTAFANTENIDEAYTVIPISVTASRYSSQIQISKRSSFVRVNVENLVSNEFDIAVETTGDPFTNCFVNSISTSPKKVVVTGPESVVGMIDKALVYADVTNVTDSVATSGAITLFDIYGNEIPQTRLSLNRTVADIDISILMRKNLSVDVETTGSPADGFMVTRIEVNPDPITVIGTYDTLSGMDSIKVQSPVFNLAGATQNVSASVRTAEFLPENVFVEDSEQGTIEISIEIIGKVDRSFDVPSSNINFEGVGEGLAASVNGASVSVKINDYESELDKILAADITGEVDVTSLTKGTYSLPVVINGQYAGSASAVVEITISDKGTVEDTEDLEQEITP